MSGNWRVELQNRSFSAGLFWSDFIEVMLSNAWIALPSLNLKWAGLIVSWGRPWHPSTISFHVSQRLNDPDSFLGGGQICSWKSRCLCETNKHPGWIVYWVSSGRVNICVLISTFIVDERDKDGGRTCWQVIWLSGSFPGALVWSSFIPALLLFWPVCIAIATARESLFLLHSAGNPLLVGRCRGSYLHLIFTPIRAGKWTEMFCESEKLDRTCGAGHDLGGGVWRGDRKSETKWTRGGNSLWLSRGRPCCCKPALNRLN